MAAFKRLRILQISVRPQQFLGVMINEAELLEKYHIEIVPVTATELFDTIRKVREEKREQIQELVRGLILHSPFLYTPPLCCYIRFCFIVAYNLCITNVFPAAL